MRATTSARVRRWAGHHPLVVDVLLAVVVVGFGSAGRFTGFDGQVPRPPTTADALAIAIALVAVAARRTWPQHVLVAAATASATLISATGERQPVLLAAVGIVAYTVGVRTDRRRAWLTAAVVGVGLYLSDAITNAATVWAPGSLGIFAWIGMAIAIGDATRSRRAYIAEVEERALRAERTREQEAARRVVEERLRIARELHDVLAHHIAVINVQAGAASHVLDRHPEQVRPALTHIRAACDTVLSELSSIVGVLRQTDDPEPGTEPTRGLARLTDVVDALATAGLTVRRRQSGEARPLPAVVDLAAYRIAQEALTNAHKHGTGTAELTLAYTATGISVEVANTIAPDRAATRSGHGIVGMRERAAAAGGTLAAGPGPDGRFTVRTELPAPEPRTAP